MWSATRSSETTTGKIEEEDPFIGDLNNWEFLTVFFDHDDFLADQIPIPASKSSMHEKSHNVFSGTGTSGERRIDSFHQCACSRTSSGYPASPFIEQKPNGDRVPFVPLGDESLHPFGIPSNNFSMSVPPLHRQEEQSISDSPSPYYGFLPSSASSFFPHNGNVGVEPIRYIQSAERLEVQRVPMGIVGYRNGSLSSGKSICEFSAPFQLYSDRCTVGTVTHDSYHDIELSQDSLDGHSTRVSTRKGGSFFDYSPPLPRHDLLKPLTAYNFFYRDERDNIIGGMQADGDPIPPALCDYSETKLRELLNQRWYIDPGKKKRSHRKTHGKLPFET
jgi:hypothetical protein